MRRDDERAATTVQVRGLRLKCIQAISIDDERHRRVLHHHARELRCLCVPRQPRTKREDRLAVAQAREIIMFKCVE